MKLQYFKNLFTILLIGFIYINTSLISFAALETVKYNCPAGSQGYYATDVDKLTTAESILRWVPGLADIGVRPTGCISTYKIKAGGVRYCENSAKTKYSPDGNEIIGCFADATAVKIYTECSDGTNVDICKTITGCSWNDATKKCTGESILYTTLNAIYTTGTGFVSGLLSKSGMSEYKVIVDIPCDNAITKIVGGADCAKTKGYAKSVPLYVARLYQFGFGIVGVVALLMIIYGAAQYTLSAGGLQTEDAKEIIQNALYGLLLLFAAYLILYTINPGLVSIKAPTLTPINVEKFLVSKQLEATAPATGNTPAATQGQTIANCNVATKTGNINDSNNPIKTICTNCNVGYTLLVASNKCEKTCSNSGTTYDLSSKKCLECAAAGVNIAKLIKDGVIKTDGDILGYFPNLPNDCPVLKITVSSGATTPPPVPPFQPPR